jgi:hypothetical protein
MEGHSKLWDDCSSFMYTHNWWHTALFYLDRGASDTGFYFHFYFSLFLFLYVFFCFLFFVLFFVFCFLHLFLYLDPWYFLLPSSPLLLSTYLLSSFPFILLLFPLLHEDINVMLIICSTGSL